MSKETNVKNPGTGLSDEGAMEVVVKRAVCKELDTRWRRGDVLTICLNPSVFSEPVVSTKVGFPGTFEECLKKAVMADAGRAFSKNHPLTHEDQGSGFNREQMAAAYMAGVRLGVSLVTVSVLSSATWIASEALVVKVERAAGTEGKEEDGGTKPAIH